MPTAAAKQWAVAVQMVERQVVGDSCITLPITYLCPANAEGVKAEAAYAKDGTLPDPASTDNAEFKIVLGLIRDGLAKNPQRWTKMAKNIVGVSEETTTGVKRLYEMQVRARNL